MIGRFFRSIRTSLIGAAGQKREVLRFDLLGNEDRGLDQYKQNLLVV
jgi:hypothetical protein